MQVDVCAVVVVGGVVVGGVVVGGVDVCAVVVRGVVCAAVAVGVDVYLLWCCLYCLCCVITHMIEI